MAILSYDQLNSPKTEDESLSMVLTRLTELGFSATAWQSGSFGLTFARLIAWLHSKGTELVQGLLATGYNSTATGTALDGFSDSHYNNQRIGAVAAQFLIQHTVAVGSGPYSVNVGDLVVTDGVYTYRNIAGYGVVYPVSLTSATPVTLLYAAETPGQAPGNAPAGTITTLVTTLAGVTVTNPSGAYLAGSNAETDANLRARNIARWASLAIERPAQLYIGMILETLPGYRVSINDQNPRGAGTVDIYIAQAAAPANGSDVTAAQTTTNARRAVTANVLVIAAASIPVDIAGTVYITSALNNATTRQAIQTAVTNYVNGLPIGGVNLGNGTRVIPTDGIEAAIRSVSGVVNVDLTSPTVDLTQTQFAISVVGQYNLSYTSV